MAVLTEPGERSDMRNRGFTMIELLVVLTIVAMLLSLVAPRYIHQESKAREVALRENLAGLRAALDYYYGDKGRYPYQLDALVRERYLRSIPVDPLTHQRDWQLLMLEQEGGKVIYDVKSNAKGMALDGSAYSSW